MLGLGAVAEFPVAGEGSFTQTLTATLFSNSQTFYAPAVTPGVVTLTPSLFSNTQAFYAHTVTVGAVTLSPRLFSSTQAFYSPTVTPGTVTLSPSLLSNSNVFYLPMVAGGATSAIEVQDTRANAGGGKKKRYQFNKDGEYYAFNTKYEVSIWLDEQVKQAEAIVEQVIAAPTPKAISLPKPIIVEKAGKSVIAEIVAYNRHLETRYNEVMQVLAEQAANDEEEEITAILLLM